MTTKLYAISFDCRDFYQEALELIKTARIATSVVHGHAAVRLDTLNWYDDQTMRLLIDSSTRVGRTMMRILTALLDSMFGDNCFTICQANECETLRVDLWKRSRFAPRV